MKNKGSTKIFVAFLVLIIGVLLLIFYPWNEGNYEDVSDTPVSELRYVVDTQYVDAKAELISQGWTLYIPVNDREFDSALDAEFPEIGWCGSGVDAICNVGFSKGTETKYLNVKKGGRDGSTEWIVVGTE